MIVKIRKKIMSQNTAQTKEEILERIRKNQRKRALGEVSCTKIDKMKTQYELPKCTFCFEPLEKELQFLHCGHVFHQECIEGYSRVKKVCPVCKFNFTGFPPQKLFFDIQKIEIDDSRRVNFLRGLNAKTAEEVDQIILDKNEALMDKIIEVEDKIAKTQRSSKEVEKTNRRLEKVHDKIRGKINGLMQEKNAYQEQELKLKREIDDLKSQVSGRNVAIRDLKKKAVELQKYKNRFESESDYTTKQLIKKKDDGGLSLEVKCNFFFDQALRYNSKFNSISHKHRSDYKELQKLKNRDQNLQDEIKKLKDKITERDKDNRELGDELDRRIGQLKKYKKRFNDLLENQNFGDYTSGGEQTITNLPISNEPGDEKSNNLSRLRRIKTVRSSPESDVPPSFTNFGASKPNNKEEATITVDDLSKEIENRKKKPVKGRRRKKKIGLFQKFKISGLENELEKVSVVEKNITRNQNKKSNDYLFNPNRIKGARKKKVTTLNIRDMILGGKKY